MALAAPCTQDVARTQSATSPPPVIDTHAEVGERHSVRAHALTPRPEYGDQLRCELLHLAEFQRHRSSQRPARISSWASRAFVRAADDNELAPEWQMCRRAGTNIMRTRRGSPHDGQRRASARPARRPALRLHRLVSCSFADRWRSKNGEAVFSGADQAGASASGTVVAIKG